MSTIQEETNRFGGKHSFSMLWRFNPEWYGMIGSKCKKCGTEHYPRREVCVYPCDGHDLEDVQLPVTGTIRSNGLNTRATDGYGDVQPQAMATIKLDNGPHICAELINVPLEFVRKSCIDRKLPETLNGKKVRMVIRRFRKHDNGDITYGHKFEVLDPITY
jgi:uncharacterized protein